MKRITSIVLLLFFLAGNSYAGINIHYCGGELQSISMVTKTKACGMCGAMTSKKGCCKDVQKLLKADDFSKVISNLNLKAFFVSLTAIIYPGFYASLCNCYDEIKHAIPGDIPKLKTPTFIRICSLII